MPGRFQPKEFNGFCRGAPGFLFIDRAEFRGLIRALSAKNSTESFFSEESFYAKLWVSKVSPLIWIGAAQSDASPGNL